MNTAAILQTIKKQRSLQVILVLLIYFCIAHKMPLSVHQGLYTVSLLIKDVLMWMLPITVCFFIAQAISSFHRTAPLFIVTLVCFEALSNFSSVWYAFISGHIAESYLPPVQAASAYRDDFHALWRLPMLRPQWWTADKGALLGLLLGCLAAFRLQANLQRIMERGKEVVQWMLTHIFARLIPLFVLGFVVRMHQTNLLSQLVAEYTFLLLWLVIFMAIYIVVLFVIGSGSAFMQAIKNLLPAGGLSLTSGCSISTMPWTIAGCKKNLRNPQLAEAIIPATTNIQQIGDCIANSFLCFLIYRHFYGYAPELATWVQFSIIFMLVRFATAAVLGGAIFIMIPIYEKYLSFTPEMVAIILAFNVILDPLITCCNVLANGALCRVFERVWIAALSLSPKK